MTTNSIQHGRPDGGTVNHLLADVVKHRRPVDGVHRSDESGAKTAQQVAVKLGRLRRRSVRLPSTQQRRFFTFIRQVAPRCGDDTA